MDVDTIMVSGASGFIGGRVAAALEAAGCHVVRMSRSANCGHRAVHADLLDRVALLAACRDVSVVVHCAGYAHANDCRSAAALHREVNFVGTSNLVEAAGLAGVRRFIYLSSVKAMGEPGGGCVDEDWPYPPDTHYGRSKREAEEVVLQAGRHFGMEVTNLRLAMVYGRGGRGNLQRMARGVSRGWFPPLPETGAKRSLVHVDDVVSALRAVLYDARADGKTYIVADMHAYSGREIYDGVRAALGLRVTRWRCPARLLRMAGVVGDAVNMIIGQRLPFDGRAIDRLLAAECYSPQRIFGELGWCARVSLADGLRETFAKS